MENKPRSIGFIRLDQIIGNQNRGICGLIPVGRTTWYQGIKDGRYPKPVHLSERCVAWRAEDINALIKQLSSGGE